MMNFTKNINDEHQAQIYEFYNQTKQFESRIGVVIPLIFAIIIVIGLFGNFLVVIVAFSRKMRNSTYTLIVGLACSDLMFLTICVPFTAIDYASTTWLFEPWMCKMINYLQHASAYSSVWTLTLMALDRYLAVCHPIDSMTLRSMRNAVFTLLVVNVLILLSQTPVAQIYGIYEYDFVFETRTTCTAIRIATGEATVTEVQLYYFSFNIFGYLLPLSITCLLYYHMLRRLWYTSHHYRIASSSASFRSRPESVKAKRKATRLVLFVVIVWAFCWLPLNVCFFLSGLFYPESLIRKGGKIMVIIQISGQVLAYMNSCLNPILYAFLSDNYRKGFIRILCSIIKFLTLGHCCLSIQFGYDYEFHRVDNELATAKAVGAFTLKTDAKIQNGNKQIETIMAALHKAIK